jgi:hypothetical protein
MKNLEEELRKYCEIYKLNFNSFKIIKKNFLFSKKIIILYGVNNYYFKISKKIKDISIRDIDVSNDFFPYFKVLKNSNLENWISSIQAINIQKSRLLKSIQDGKKLRDSFKKKFKV